MPDKHPQIEVQIVSQYNALFCKSYEKMFKIANAVEQTQIKEFPGFNGLFCQVLVSCIDEPGKFETIFVTQPADEVKAYLATKKLHINTTITNTQLAEEIHRFYLNENYSVNDFISSTPFSNLISVYDKIQSICKKIKICVNMKNICETVENCHRYLCEAQLLLSKSDIIGKDDIITSLVGSSKTILEHQPLKSAKNELLLYIKTCNKGFTTGLLKDPAFTQFQCSFTNVPKMLNKTSPNFQKISDILQNIIRAF